MLEKTDTEKTTQSSNKYLIIIILALTIIFICLIGTVIFYLRPKNGSDTSKETTVVKETDKNTQSIENGKSFDIDLSYGAYVFELTSTVKVIGTMPQDFSVQTDSSTNPTAAYLSNQQVLLSIGTDSVTIAEKYNTAEEVYTKSFGNVFFSIDPIYNIEPYKFSGKYGSPSKDFDKNGYCYVYGGQKVEAPCGMNNIGVTDDATKTLKHIFSISCNVNDTADFQTCHDIVKSISWEEVK